MIKKTNIHPEGAIFARGACDDKGQMFMHIKAFEWITKNAKLNFNIKFLIEGEEEVGFDWNTRRPVIKVNPRYFRPTEVESLLGDPTKAKEKLGWEPKITFDQLVEDMCIYGQ